MNHLDVALGSQADVEVQLEIAMRVGYLTPRDHERLHAIVDEIGRMLNGLSRRCSQKTVPLNRALPIQTYHLPPTTV